MRGTAVSMLGHPRQAGIRARSEAPRAARHDTVGLQAASTLPFPVDSEGTPRTISRGRKTSRRPHRRRPREDPMSRACAVWLSLVLPLFAAIPASSQQGDPIKIGVIEPLSGPVAASGNYVRMGAEIARDSINARGGVLGRPVQLLIEDNKSDPKEAATAAEKLIVRVKVPVIVGAWGSSMTRAAMPQLEEYGGPMVGGAASAAGT